MATRDIVDAAAPRLVGRYELLAPITSGALGELWQARIASGPEEGRVVGIRRVSRSVGLEQREVERLTNAGFAAMELRNPRIAAVLDVVVGATEIAIVSEHVGGAVLQSLLCPQSGKRVNVPSSVAARIVLDLLEAIDILREPWAEIFASDSADDALLRASLHGGLLPDGLLVASYGEAMLLEAGLAGVALTIPTILDRPEVISYRAPEQLEPGRQIDERTDVFGAGILLWEMISGRTLFGAMRLPRAPSVTAPGKTRADPIAVSGARRRVLSHPIARLDTLPLLKGKVPKELADWAGRCLERDPSRRFANVREAMDALSALGGRLVSSHESVVTFVESLGLTGPVLPHTDDGSGPSSNRPTSPPQEDGATPSKSGTHDAVTRRGLQREAAAEHGTGASDDEATADYGETAEAHAARMLDSIPPSTDIESLPPSEPPSATDVESLPPSEPPSTDVESLPPSGAKPQIAVPGVVHFASVPPAEAVTVPPLMAVEATGNADTSAPVAWPLEEEAQASPKSGGTGEPELSTRRARSKKIVLGVLAAAVLLVIVAVLRAAFGSAPGGVPAAQAPAPTTREVAGDAPRRPSIPEAQPSPAPSVEPSAQASTATPTSVPTVPPGNLGETPVRKAVSSKKRPWRPSGI